jgi:hypothetical protein
MVNTGTSGGASSVSSQTSYPQEGAWVWMTSCSCFRGEWQELRTPVCEVGWGDWPRKQLHRRMCCLREVAFGSHILHSSLRARSLLLASAPTSSLLQSLWSPRSRSRLGYRHSRFEITTSRHLA